jgi:hypothetical protein
VRPLAVIAALSFFAAALLSGFRLYTGLPLVISQMTLPASTGWSGVFVTAMLGVFLVVASRR